jgi:hypothetical protein
LKALETLASTVTTLPNGMALLKATPFTDAVTTILLECLRAAILAARSIRANNSPPKDYSKDLFASKTQRSVSVVKDLKDVLVSFYMSMDYFLIIAKK